MFEFEPGERQSRQARLQAVRCLTHLANKHATILEVGGRLAQDLEHQFQSVVFGMKTQFRLPLILPGKGLDFALGGE